MRPPSELGQSTRSMHRRGLAICLGVILLGALFSFILHLGLFRLEDELAEYFPTVTVVIFDPCDLVRARACSSRAVTDVKDTVILRIGNRTHESPS